MFRFVRYSVLIVGLIASAGCADSANSPPTTQPTSVRDRQDAALKDPFSYGGNTDKVDMTGGGIGTYDKNAMNHDMNSVFNP